MGVLSVIAFALTLLVAVLAGLKLPLLTLSHLQHGGAWTADLARWSSLLGERRAAAFNTWCSVVFLALPVLALLWALVSWAWRLVTAAGVQIRARRATQQPLSSLLVLLAFGLGAALIVVEVVVLTRRRSSSPSSTAAPPRRVRRWRRRPSRCSRTTTAGRDGGSTPFALGHH